MVIIAIPQVEAEQDAVVALGGGGDGGDSFAGGDAGAAGLAGEEAGDDINDIDEPPPQALNAISKVHAAAGNHRRRIADAWVGRCERCMVAPRDSCVGECLLASGRLPSGRATNTGNSQGIQSVVVTRGR